MNNGTKKSILTILSVIFIMGILVQNCGEKGSRIIARVGGRTITVQEFESNFARGKTDETLTKAELQEKKDHLEKMINNELQIIAAYRNNLDKDEDVLKTIEEQKESIMLRHLYNVEIIDKVIKDSEIKDIYQKSKKDVKVLDIFLRFPPNPKEEEQRAFDDTVKVIKKKIGEGVDFEELVQKYSQERNRKGLLKWSPATANNPLHQKVFSMKVGEISEPIKIDRGYSIVKVLEIINADVKPFEKEKNRIKQTLMKIRGKDLQKSAMQYLEDIKKKYNSKMIGENIDHFLKVYKQAKEDTTQDKKSWPTKPNPMGSFENFNDEDKKLSIATYDGGNITIGKLIEDLEKYPATRRPNIDDKRSLEEVIDRMFLSHELLTLQLKNKNIENDKEVRKQLKSELERLISSKVKRLEVDDKIIMTDEARQKYYEEHKEDFKNPAERNVQEIYVTDEKLADQITQRAKSGEDFTKLARKYNESQRTKAKEGKLGYIKESYRSIGPLAFKTEIGGVGGPINLGRNYVIIKVLDEKEETYKTFDEAKRTVESRLQRQLKEDREKEWLDELKKDIKITVYEKQLEATFQN